MSNPAHIPDPAPAPVWLRPEIGVADEPRQRVTRLLHELPGLLHTSGDPGSLVAAAAEAARSLTGAVFALFEPADAEWPRTLVGLRWSDFADVPTPGLASILEPDGRPARLVADVTKVADDAQRLYGVLTDGRLIRSWLVAPLRDPAGQLQGALYLGHAVPAAFDEIDQQQLSILADALGIALDAGRRHGERERVLHALEQSLLPPVLPTIPGIDLAARYRPAADAARVGGDFYDAFRTDDRRWSMMLGDVCGVGAEAAALTGAVRSTVRGLVPDLAPAAALERLNTSLDAAAAESQFVTAVLIDVATAPSGSPSITFANGGHPPPVLMRSGTACLLESGHGCLLGVFPRVGASDISVELECGDALVLYTDGITEARDEHGELFGFERLLDLAAASSGRTAAGIARRIELAAVSHAAGTVDDIAVFVIRRRPARAPRDTIAS